VLGGNRYDPSVLLRLIRLIRNLRPDVVNTWLTAMDIVGGCAALITGVPWILSERSAADGYPRSILNGVRALLGIRALSIIANSRGGAQYWQGLRRERDGVFLIPNFVPIDEIRSTVPASGYGPPENSGRDLILFVGRLSLEKNIESIIRACALLEAQRDFDLVLCGGGPLHDELVALAVAEGIAENTHFLGAVSSVWPWMKRAQVCVAVSHFEGSPNVILEAAAAGVPLVVSDLGAYLEVVDENSALIVPVGAGPGEIANALQAALTDRVTALRRVERATERVRGMASDDIAIRYAEVYESTIAKFGRKS
jgi:glycosyltransferase involved in cell wall biosynthesis